MTWALTEQEKRHLILWGTWPSLVMQDGLESLFRERMERAWDEGHRTPNPPDLSVSCECFAYSEAECGCGNYGATTPAPNPYREDSK